MPLSLPNSSAPTLRHIASPTCTPTPQPSTASSSIPPIHPTTTPGAVYHDEAFSSAASRSSGAALAPPVLLSSKRTSKRLLVPKKLPVVPSSESGIRPSPPPSRLPRPIPRRTCGQARPGNVFNAPAKLDPPAETEDSLASVSDRRPPLFAQPPHPQPPARPEPIAILPVKTEDGASTNRTRLSLATTPNGSGRSSHFTARTQQALTLCSSYDDPISDDLPVLVKKKKSRLALDLGWALGERTNLQTKYDPDRTVAPTGRSPTPTLKGKGSLLGMALRKNSLRLLVSDTSGDAEKEKRASSGANQKWKWSLGLGRAKKDVDGMVMRGSKRSKCKRRLVIV